MDAKLYQHGKINLVNCLNNYLYVFIVFRIGSLASAERKPSNSGTLERWRAPCSFWAHPRANWWSATVLAISDIQFGRSHAWFFHCSNPRDHIVRQPMDQRGQTIQVRWVDRPKDFFRPAPTSWTDWQFGNKVPLQKHTELHCVCR